MRKPCPPFSARLSSASTSGGSTAVPLFGSTTLPGWTLRRVTFLLIQGFPLAMGLAWVYNITEEGLMRDVGEEQARKMGPEGKPFPSNGVLIGLLVLIAGLLLYPRFTGPVEAPSSEPVQKKSPVSQPAVSQEDRAAASLDPQSVAVLYSDDNSPGDTLTAPADGLTEHLIHRLAQVGDLEIISRHGVEPYREQSLPLDSIARWGREVWLRGALSLSGIRLQSSYNLSMGKASRIS